MRVVARLPLEASTARALQPEREMREIDYVYDPPAKNVRI